MTASDHLKQRTGSLGGDQDEKLVEQLIADYEQATANPPVGVCVLCQAMIWAKEAHMIDSRGKFHPICEIRAALAQKTRECEELTQDRNEWKDAAHTRGAEASGLMRDCDALKAQVEQLGRQVAEMSDAKKAADRALGYAALDVHLTVLKNTSVKDIEQGWRDAAEKLSSAKFVRS